MEVPEKTEYLIVGAGYGGLASAALLAKAGRDVQLHEAHIHLGGCAGKYQRGPFIFDVGATTLSGIDFNGPIQRLVSDLHLKLDLIHCDPGIVIQLKDGRSLSRHANFETWMTELEGTWPDLDHRPFWQRLEKVNQEAWAILEELPAFPPKLENLHKYLRPKFLGFSLPLATTLIRPLKDWIPKEFQRSSSWMDFINEQLLISTQTDLENVPQLVGAMGLCYPCDTRYAMGGITSLAYQLEKSIQKNGGYVFSGSPVKSIVRKKNGFLVETKKGIIHAEKIICNAPIWNLPNIFPEISSFQKYRHESRNIWGAITANFAVELETPISTLYHQVHLNQDVPTAHGKSVFISLSHPEDRLRAPKGHQVVTISIHTKTDELPNRLSEKEKYIEVKNQIAKTMADIFEARFSKYGIKKIKHLQIGTPQTFERYTSRHLGRVGGIPHSFKTPLFLFPGQKTAEKNIFLVGDTTFPGQGIVGVVCGAYNLLKGEKII